MRREELFQAVYEFNHRMTLARRLMQDWIIDFEGLQALVSAAKEAVRAGLDQMAEWR